MADPKWKSTQDAEAKADRFRTGGPSIRVQSDGFQEPPSLYSPAEEKWVDPVENPTLRCYQFGVWNPASNRFGTDVRGAGRGHQGIDLLAPIGTPVRAVRSGVISSIGNQPDGFGDYIMLKFTHYNRTLYALYGHLSQVNVEVKDEVRAGSIIGLSGDTGNASTVPVGEKHLHFGISTVAQPTLMKYGNWLNPENFMTVRLEEVIPY